jgi:peptide/nickel transport system permease protein
VAVTVGVILGTISGLSGGWADEIIMRTTDMFLAFPSLILAMAIAATLGANLTNSLLALSLAWWPWYARLVRGEVLRIREREFVLASTGMGASPLHIILKHLLPNIASPLLVQISMDYGYAILSTAGLSFIGLGAQQPSPEWGLTIWLGREYIRESWWYITFPGVALMVTVLGFNLVGDGLRDFLDPRLRRVQSEE